MQKVRLMKKEQAFIDKLTKVKAKPLYELSPEEAREVLLNVQNFDVPVPDVKKYRINVPLGNKREMSVLIVKPADIEDDLPTVFYLHGGGWVMGDDVTHERFIRELADSIPASIVFPIYQQSPESQFPQTTEDLFNVLEYIVSNAKDYALDISKLAVAGDSVGGNMATVMALMAKEQGGVPKIDFQLLFYPVTDAKFENKSYTEFAKGPWLTKKAMEWFWNEYAPDEKDRSNIYASPLRASIEQLKGLPPAMIVNAENDVLRDEGEDYAKKLDAAGVDVSSIRINGTIHDFVVLNELADSSSSQIALMLAVSKLQEVFFAE